MEKKQQVIRTSLASNTNYYGCTIYISNLNDIENCIFENCSFRENTHIGIIKNCTFHDCSFRDLRINKKYNTQFIGGSIDNLYLLDPMIKDIWCRSVGMFIFSFDDYDLHFNRDSGVVQLIVDAKENHDLSLLEETLINYCMFGVRKILVSLENCSHLSKQEFSLISYMIRFFQHRAWVAKHSFCLENLKYSNTFDTREQALIFLQKCHSD